MTKHYQIIMFLCISIIVSAIAIVAAKTIFDSKAKLNAQGVLNVVFLYYTDNGEFPSSWDKLSDCNTSGNPSNLCESRPILETFFCKTNILCPRCPKCRVFFGEGELTGFFTELSDTMQDALKKYGIDHGVASKFSLQPFAIMSVS